MLAASVTLLTGAAALIEPPVALRAMSAERACSALPHVSVLPDAALGRRALLSAAVTGMLLPAAPALAESTLITRQQAYTRYVPRIERGRDFWAGGLRKFVANAEWASITREFEPVGKNKGGAIAKIFGPMRLWASSWSGKTVTDKTLAMNQAIDELEDAAKNLEVAALGKEKASGFAAIFGGTKTMDENNRRALAQAAYKKGVIAINKYIEIGNDGMGLQFAALDTID